MKILIKAATILDPKSSFNNQIKNILLESGNIISITNETLPADIIIESQSLMVSPGWIDMRASSGDPGYEHREDLMSFSNAAARGGFTEVVCMPVTKPVIQTKEVVAYIQSRSKEHLVEIHPAAAVTIDRAGKELCDMMDLHHAGAIAFTDGDRPLWHPDILLKTLQYLQAFDGLLISHAEELHLTHAGQMNEGIESTMLGLKGIPKLAEELMVQRDIDILKYTGGKIHFSRVSSPQTLALIKQAKQATLNVTCDVAVYQLVLDDSELKSFDTNLKVNPPLRSKEDIAHLWQGLTDGTIDAIVSDHIAFDEESKNVEFDMAEFGMTGLETLFALLITYGKQRLTIEEILDKICFAPRNILALPVPTIEVGQNANLTAFDLTLDWTYHRNKILSKSKNSPFVDATLTGKVLAVFNKGKHILY